MEEHTGQILGDFIPLGIFIYLALVINGIIKPKKDMPLLTSPSTLIKICVYAGIFIFTVLIIIGLMGK